MSPILFSKLAINFYYFPRVPKFRFFAWWLLSADPTLTYPMHFPHFSSETVNSSMPIAQLSYFKSSDPLCTLNTERSRLHQTYGLFKPFRLLSQNDISTWNGSGTPWMLILLLLEGHFSESAWTFSVASSPKDDLASDVEVFAILLQARFVSELGFLRKLNEIFFFCTPWATEHIITIITFFKSLEAHKFVHWFV